MARLLDKGGKHLGKVGARVATLGHALQVPHKFQFDLKFTKVEGLPKGRKCVLILERRDKVECSNLFVADETRSATMNQTLSMAATLFRKDGSEEFDVKKVKIAVRLQNKDGKTISKIHLDFGKYAKVPSGEVEVKLKMTGGAIVFAKIASALMKSGRSNGPSSQFSAMTTGSGGLGNSGDLDLDDLDDLDIGDDDLTPSVASRKPSNVSVPRQISNLSNGAAASPSRLPPTTETVELLTRDNVRLEEAMHKSERETKRVREDIAEARERLQALEMYKDDAAMEAQLEFERLKRKLGMLESENKLLEEKNEELQMDLLQAKRVQKDFMDISQLEDDLESAQHENHMLQDKLAAARKQVEREPKIDELREELQRAKCRLETISVEKQKALNDLKLLQTVKNEKKGGRTFLWFKI